MTKVTISITNASGAIATTGNICPVVKDEVGKPLNSSPFSVTDTHDNSIEVPGPGQYTYAFMIVRTGSFKMKASKAGSTCGEGDYNSANGGHDHLNFRV